MKTIQELQNLLAESSIFRQNLYSHHWNIRGDKFYPLHGIIEELYDSVGTDIDTFAERILALGGVPEHNFSVYLTMSGIKESEMLTECKAIETNILESLTKSKIRLYIAIKAAEEENDQGSIDLFGSKIRCTEKQIWLWSAQSGKQVGMKATQTKPKTTETSEPPEPGKNRVKL